MGALPASISYLETRTVGPSLGAASIHSADEHLPAGCDALIAGGGFPEVYAAELTANAALRAEVRQRARRPECRWSPSAPGCSGSAADLDGHQQCGVLPASARMTGG